MRARGGHRSYKTSICTADSHQISDMDSTMSITTLHCVLLCLLSKNTQDIKTLSTPFHHEPWNVHLLILQGMSMWSGVQYAIKREMRIPKATSFFKHCFSVMIGNITVIVQVSNPSSMI